MTQITVAKGRSSLEVSFPYNEAVIDRIKSISGYEWDKQRRVWKFPIDVASVEGLQAAFGDRVVMQDSAARWYEAASNRAARILEARELQDVDLLYEKAAMLYPYQRVMVNVMCVARRFLCSDQMGLGKTVEAIATVRELELRGEIDMTWRRYLVVCPNSMRYTWAREIRTWFPEELPIFHINTGAEGWDSREGWYVINWEKTLRREEALTHAGWSVVIGDESHRMKNKDAKQTKSMMKVDAHTKILLSGTPIKNHVPDLWSQLHWLDRARFPSYWKFFDRFVLSQEAYYHGRTVREVLGTKNEAALRQVLLTVQMGRTVESAWHDRPTLVGPRILRVTLTDAQRKAYDQMRDEFVAWLESEDSGDDEEVIKAGSWMTQAIRLKQIAGSLGIFSDTHRDSAKIDMLLDKMDEAPDEKFVVMSQFRTMIMELHERLKAKDVPHIVMTGQGVGRWTPHEGTVPYANRDEAMQALNLEDWPRAFLATTQTGGEGITLVGARYFYFLDLLWTPADNDQAWARVYRRGQTRTTFVFALMAEDTIDFSGVLPKLRTKRDIIDAVLGPDNEDEASLPITLYDHGDEPSLG